MVHVYNKQNLIELEEVFLVNEDKEYNRYTLVGYWKDMDVVLYASDNRSKVLKLLELISAMLDGTKKNERTVIDLPQLIQHIEETTK